MDVSDLRAIFQLLLDESGLPDRVAKLEQRSRTTEAWEDGPACNPAPVMGERGERRPIPFSDCQGEHICDPTGTDPMPSVSPGDSSFAVYNANGRWEP